MRFKTMVALALVLAMTATAALAGTPKTDGRMDIETFLQMNRIHGDAFTSRAMFQGFEGGVIPAGWTVGITNPTRTWGVTSGAAAGAVEGLYCAFVGYDLHRLPERDPLVQPGRRRRRRRVHAQLLDGRRLRHQLGSERRRDGRNQRHYHVRLRQQRDRVHDLREVLRRPQRLRRHDRDHHLPLRGRGRRPALCWTP